MTWKGKYRISRIGLISRSEFLFLEGRLILDSACQLVLDDQVHVYKNICDIDMTLAIAHLTPSSFDIPNVIITKEVIVLNS